MAVFFVVRFCFCCANGEKIHTHTRWKIETGQAWVMNFGDKDDRIPWEEARARPWEEWCRKCLGVSEIRGPDDESNLAFAKCLTC